jgi:hypothetical protein
MTNGIGRMSGKVPRAALVLSCAVILLFCVIGDRSTRAATSPSVTLRLIEEIDSLSTEIAAIDRDYGALIANLSVFNLQAEEAGEARRKAEKNLEAKRDELNGRLVALYKSGRTSWFSVLLDSNDVLDFVDRITWTERIAREDTRVLDEVKSAEAALRTQQQSLIEKRRALQSKCNWAIRRKAELERKLSECMRRLSATDPVLGKVMAVPQTELSRRINAYLAKRRSPLTGYGIVFVMAEQRTGVSARLLVGLAHAESSCATAGTYWRTNHNAWGMKGPQPRIAGGIPAQYGYCTWPDWEVAIQQAADFIIHYWGRAQTAMQLPGYCETGGPGSDWEKRVETARNAI